MLSPEETPPPRKPPQPNNGWHLPTILAETYLFATASANSYCGIADVVVAVVVVNELVVVVVVGVNELVLVEDGEVVAIVFVTVVVSLTVTVFT